MHIHPPLLTLLTLLTQTCASTPSPPLLTTDNAISLWPRDMLFYRQLKDLQTFTSALGGIRASPILNSGISDRPFDVGGASFVDFKTAAQRSCDEQFEGCQRVANRGGSNGGDGKRDGKRDGKDGKKGKRAEEGKLTVGMCDGQKDKCNQAQQAAKVQDFTAPVASTNIGPDPQFPDFDLICEG